MGALTLQLQEKVLATQHAKEMVHNMSPRMRLLEEELAASSTKIRELQDDNATLRHKYDAVGEQVELLLQGIRNISHLRNLIHVLRAKP